MIKKPFLNNSIFSAKWVQKYFSFYTGIKSIFLFNLNVVYCTCTHSYDIKHEKVQTHFLFNHNEFTIKQKHEQ